MQRRQRERTEVPRGGLRGSASATACAVIALLGALDEFDELVIFSFEKFE